MNRCYRLVFNRALSLFQVASETTRLRSKAGGSRTAAGIETAMPAPRLHALAAAVALGLGALAMPALAVDHVIDSAETGTPGGHAIGQNAGAGGASAGYNNDGGAGGTGHPGSGGSGVGGNGGVGGGMYTGGTGGGGGNTASHGYGGGGGGGGGDISGTGGGGGGGGGVGFMLQSGDTLINNSTVTGGQGGFGGTGSGGGSGGAGGGGGAGIFAEAGVQITNHGTIQGGAGNVGAIGAQPGGWGFGGTAVILTGDSRLINNGTISGGLSPISDRANAIELSGGGNTLELHSDSVIVGNVVSTSGTTNGGDTLALGGDTDSSLNVSQIGASATYRGFANFLKTGSSTWALDGATAELTSWTIGEGTLSIEADAALGSGARTLTLDGGTLLTTQDLASIRNIAIDSGGTIDNGGNAIALHGEIAGGGALTFAGTGITTLSGDGSQYTGATTIATGTTLALGGTVNYQSSLITVDGTFDLSGTVAPTWLNRIAGDGQIALGGNQLAVLNAADDTFSGVISGSGSSFVLKGGTLTLAGINTYSGNTMLQGGVLSIADDRNLGDAAGELMLAGGTLRTTADITIARDIFVSSLADSVIDAGGNDIELSGPISGSGDLAFEGGGNITLTGASTYTGDAEIGLMTGLRLLDGAVFPAGSLTVSGGGFLFAESATTGRLNNTGIMLVRAGKTLTVSGDFTNSGAFNVQVNGMANYSQLSVTGAAALGGQLFVHVGNDVVLAAGSLANVISAGGITGTFDSYDDNSALFDFAPIYDATTVSLNVTAAQGNGGGDNGGGDGPSLVEAIVAGQGNNPALGAARALDRTFANDPTGALAARFMPFSTEQQVNEAVSQSLPLLTGNSTLAMQNTLSDINGIIQSRLEGQRGLSSGDAFANSQVWVKAFGSRADQNHNGAEAGFEADTYGVSLGVDGEIASGHRVGLAFAAAKADIDSDSPIAPQSAEVDIYQLVGYGAYQLSANGELNYQLGFGQNQTDGKRVMPSFGLVAKADYDSTTTYAGIGYSHTLQLSEQTRLIPSVRIDYSKVEDESYRETGADALNLHVSGNTSEALVIGADGKLEHRLGDKATLQLNVGFGYDLVADRDALTAVYAGAPTASFVTYGQHVDPWIANGGIGFAYQATDAVEITARYDAQTRSRFDNQTASVKMLWKF